jgi:hypothetical protein
MKKTILIATVYCLSGMQAVSAQPVNSTICKDFLSKIKQGVPYIDPDDSMLAAAKIGIEAGKIVRDPFVDAQTRKKAQTICDCADFFTLAGTYYTSQMEFNAFHDKFTQQQKNGSALTQAAFLKSYLEQVDETKRSRLLDDLSFRALERSRSAIATPEEKMVGEMWSKYFTAYAPAKTSTVQSKKDDAKGDVEKYLK